MMIWVHTTAKAARSRARNERRVQQQRKTRASFRSSSNTIIIIIIILDFRQNLVLQISSECTHARSHANGLVGIWTSSRGTRWCILRSVFWGVGVWVRGWVGMVFQESSKSSDVIIVRVSRRWRCERTLKEGEKKKERKKERGNKKKKKKKKPTTTTTTRSTDTNTFVKKKKIAWRQLFGLTANA